MSKQTASNILVVSTIVLLSEKLFSNYSNGIDIVVCGFKINKILSLMTVRRSTELDADVLVCFDDDINAVGLMKVGLFGYVMPISDKSSAFINLYRPMKVTTKVEDYCSNYATRIKYEVPLAVTHGILI